MIKSISIFKDESFCLELSDQNNPEDLFLHLFSFEMDHEYKIVLDYEEFDGDYVDSLLKGFSLFDTFIIKNLSSEENKFIIDIFYMDKNFTNEEWPQKRYKDVLLKDSIKNFNFEIEGPERFIKYFVCLFNSLLEYNPDSILTKNLFVSFSVLSKLLSDGDSIILRFGDFEEEDLSLNEDTDVSPKYGLNKLVRSEIKFFIESTDLFVVDKSTMEYLNNKINLNLVISKDVN